MDKLLKVINPVYWVAFLIFVEQAGASVPTAALPGRSPFRSGFAFSILALIVTKDLVGNDLGFGWYAWLPAALAASKSRGAEFIWPVAYSVADIVGDFVGHRPRSSPSGCIGPVVSTLRGLPIASAVWKHVESKPGTWQA